MNSEGRFSFFVRHRFWFVLLAALAIAAAGGVVAYKIHRAGQPKRLAEQARALMAEGDLPGASLAARRALQLGPTSVEANEIVAELLEEARAPQALVLRRRLLHLDPESLRRHLDVIRGALRLKQLDLASQTLAAIPESDRNGAEYHAAAGAIALATGNSAKAGEHYAAARAADPDNDHYRFIHASLLLGEKDEGARSERQKVLSELAVDSKYKSAAMRALLFDAAMSGDHRAAMERGRALAEAPEASIDDQIVFLSFLKTANDPGLAEYLDKVKEQARNDGRAFATVVAWMTTQDLQEEALKWADTVPPEIVQGFPGGLGMATAYLKAEQWQEMADLLDGSNWRHMDFLRFAYRAHAARALKEPGWRAVWNQSVTMAAKLPGGSRELFRLIEPWEWPEEERALLWEIAEDVTHGRWAMAELYRRYEEAQDTAGMRRLLTRMIELEPRNDAVRSRLARLSLLLNLDTTNAFTIARELHLAEPANPDYAATYALALIKQDRPEEAVKTLDLLPAKTLREPAVAAYYGLALARSDRTAEAGGHLALGRTAPLLPEERKLLEQAEKAGEGKTGN